MAGADNNSKWLEASQLLCIRLDAIGDLLMTTPALRALKQQNPGRSITVLTSPNAARAAKLIPEVDLVLPYNAPWMKQPRMPEVTRTDFALIKKLRRLQFDACAIFTVFSQNSLPAALLAFYSGIQLRLAYCRENPYHLLTDWVPEPEPDRGIRHEVQRQLDLVAAIGAYTTNRKLSLSLSKAAKTGATELLRPIISSSERWLLMHVGATAPSRRYPKDSFAEAAGLLHRDHGFTVLVSGGPEEAELVRAVCSASRPSAVPLLPPPDFEIFCSIVAMAPLLITNNSAPVHIAAAVQTPVLDLYALTNPQHTPWLVPNAVLNRDVECKYCFKSVCPIGDNRCLSLVSPHALVKAAIGLLGATGVPFSSDAAGQNFSEKADAYTGT